MDLNNSRSNKTTSDTDKQSKIRRLKIQEKILLQQLKKSDKVQVEEKHSLEFETNYDDYESFETKMKDRFVLIKNLFDEVKIHTNSKELLADLDLDDMKRKVFDLDTHIKSLKSYLHSELNYLRNSEMDLNKQINDSTTLKVKIKNHPKVSSAKYKDIVPSPVRLLMTSPFKCTEVQQFQDFIKNSPNRYGGWNEYNHNIFVRFWQKYFGINYIPEYEDETQMDMFDTFIEELITRLHEVTEEDIKTHIKWYSRYAFLKEQQQRAIDKWKNKRSILQNNKKVTLNHRISNQSNVSFDSNESTPQTSNASSSENIKQDDKSYQRSNKRCPKKIIKNCAREKDSYMRPTKQSVYRTYLEDEAVYINSHFSTQESPKLGIPNWRIGLLTE